MAGKMDSGSDEIVSEINITPFVDVMLVLLVIFMISAPAVYSNTLKIDTPRVQKVEETASSAGHVTLKVNVSSDGKIEIENKNYNLESIGEVVRQAIKVDPRSDAIIQASGSIAYSEVMKVVDALKVLGIENVAFGVQKK
jgi:biopolymer transport protein ExbD